jgi:hypothetical protein
MTSLNPSHAEEMAHRLSVEIFGEDMSRSNLPHTYYQPIPSQPHVDSNYNPQIISFSAKQSSTLFSSSSQYPLSSN